MALVTICERFWAGIEEEYSHLQYINSVNCSPCDVIKNMADFQEDGDRKLHIFAYLHVGVTTLSITIGLYSWYCFNYRNKHFACQWHFKGLWRNVRESDCYLRLQSALSLMDLYQFLITVSKVCEHVIENLSSQLLQQDDTGELHLWLPCCSILFQIFLTVAIMHNTENVIWLISMYFHSEQ